MENFSVDLLLDLVKKPTVGSQITGSQKALDLTQMR